MTIDPITLYNNETITGGRLQEILVTEIFNYIIGFIAFICFGIICRTIVFYTPQIIRITTTPPWNILTGFLGYIIYELSHALSAKEIQSLLHINASQAPHTVSVLTLILCIPMWLLVASLFAKCAQIYVVVTQDKLKIRYFGLSLSALVCLILFIKSADLITQLQEPIKKIAVYLDYDDKKYFTTNCEENNRFDGLLILDSNNISIYTYNQNKKETEFKTIPCIIL